MQLKPAYGNNVFTEMCLDILIHVVTSSCVHALCNLPSKIAGWRERENTTEGWMSSCFSIKGFICWSSTLASSMVVIVQKFVGGVVQFIHLCILGNKETVLLHPKTSHCTPTMMQDGVFLFLYFKLVSICLVACLHCISVTVVLSCVSLHCYGDACTIMGWAWMSEQHTAGFLCCHGAQT